MARLALTVQSLPAKYPTLQPSANAWDVVFTAAGADYADGAKFTLTGKEIVIVGGGASGGTVTVTSVADPETKRTGDVTAYAVGTNEFAVLPQFQLKGWQQTDGCLYLAANAATVTFCVLRLTD
jgi:hypothetical protein